jgi:DNA polymerase-1
MELKTSLGKYSGMFYGFVRTLFSLRKKYRNFKFIVVWDNRAKAKYDIQPDYKAGRSMLSGTIWEQVTDIRTCLSVMGIDQYEKKEYEADDVMASLTKTLKAEGQVYIYTNDKDLLQLVQDGKVIVYKPKVGVNPEKFFDEEAVKNMFDVPPSKLGVFRSFDGDDSDNIKGISRVPRKIVASLVNEYSSVENIYANLDKKELTEFQKKSFEEAKDRIKKNVKIVMLDQDIQDLQKNESSFDKEKLEELLQRYEIKSIKSNDLIDLFSSNLDVRYSDPVEVVQLETISLFD